MSCLCPECGQQVQERPPRPLDMLDQLYLAFGKCCAGCDFWKQDERRTRPMGYCHKQPTGTLEGFDIFDEIGPVTVRTYRLTDAKHVCQKFQDTFDWTQLGVENPAWL